MTVQAFVVGSLGSWDSANESVLKTLQIGSNYTRLFRVSDAIKESHNIWHTQKKDSPPELCIVFYLISVQFSLNFRT